MNARRWAIVALSALAFTAGSGSAAEPRNLDLVKAELRDYFKSGEYQREIFGVATKADAWLRERAAKRAPGERLAVVFDVDETLISNWPYIESVGFGYFPADWDAWVASARAPAIEPVREVYRTARRLGIDVIVLTSRRERERPASEKNLREIGCGGWAECLMMPDAQKGTAADFKSAERTRLTAAGYTIVANLGDQESDLVGGYSEKVFKLPNPLYLTP